jgi:hypothetical protein
VNRRYNISIRGGRTTHDRHFTLRPRGSRMMPYDWFMALERADGKGMFAATTNLESYGFLPAEGAHPLNPDLLPIGFAIDPVDTAGRGRSVGLTCAACHTTDVTVQGKGFSDRRRPSQNRLRTILCRSRGRRESHSGTRSPPVRSAAMPARCSAFSVLRRLLVQLGDRLIPAFSFAN